MKSSVTAVVIFAFLIFLPVSRAQDKTQSDNPPAKAAASTAPAAKTSAALNMDTYIKLLRKDVRSQKSEVMADVMELDPDQAAKFWPIYRDYDAELTKVNDLRVANIKEYSESYKELTDAKADELVMKSMEYQKERSELLAKYYEKMKAELGGVTAARFVQVEYQLLLIIDLQIASALPIAGS